MDSKAVQSSRGKASPEEKDRKYVHLEFDVSVETREDLVRLIREHIWEFSEGLRAILGAGIGYFLAERAGAEGNGENQVVALSRELTLSEGRLAATRFELAEIKELNRRWEMSIGSIQAMNATLEKIINRQNGEIAELKAELASTREELERLRAERRDQAPANGSDPAMTQPEKETRRKSLRERLGGGPSR